MRLIEQLPILYRAPRYRLRWLTPFEIEAVTRREVIIGAGGLTLKH
ncbi:MAG: hypothetical protein AAF633_08000 [Chloroflexota bacterium]